MKLKPVLMTYENFKPYGCMLGYPGDVDADISVPDLDYWKRPMDLANFNGDGELSFMRVKQREIVTDTLDMLPESAEMYLSLDGKASIYFVAPPKAGKAAEPDMEKVQAFLYSGSGGVLINPGIWHWTPFPLARDADFYLGLRDSVLLKKDGNIVQGENQVIYHELNEKVEIEL